MSLIQFLRILMARRMIILVATLGCFVVATGIAMVLPKRYPATARVILDVIKPDPVTGQIIGTQFMRGYTRTQIELITDMRVAGAVVDRLGLANDPGTIAAFQSSGAAEADGGVRRWIAQRIIDNTSANLIEASNILEIRYEGQNPELAKRIVDVIRDAYIESSLRFRTDSAGRTGDWYREQATKAQRLLVTAETAKTEFMRANNIVMQGGVELEQQKLANLAATLVAARGNSGTQEATATARLTNDPVADQLRLQLSTIEDQLVQSSEKLGTQHPTYQALLARRNLLRTQLAQAETQTRKSVASSMNVGRKSIGELEADYEAQRTKVLGMKTVLDQLDQMQREVDLRRDQYQKAAARAAELRLEADVAETGLVVLGDAVADTNPSWPKVPLIMALSLFFGLALGVLTALITELFARRVRGAEDLAFAAGAPVLAVVNDGSSSPIRDRIKRLLTRGGKDETGDLQAI
ncbi:GNVR domain-containing protein [Sandaracinobacteroides saxicola]|uniref:Exopolysaccharide biosynthesis protein EpsF n=1 Tax=Sandaracinobacteroides saxicola TaxID=2759707 RepID=A0A7G5IFC1_9SPHN|nr:GNVR domain-containing protein [Sandaracinobacteroides saxicola]QMW22063.1 exopolysaccharide biosynthesis protein EpsF [Sandaracinobacteroides saxicola]